MARLRQAFGSVATSSLATAFIKDTLLNIRRARAVPIAVFTAPHAVFDGFAERWLQAEGTLGARLEQSFRRALVSHEAVIALGMDTPHIQPRRLRRVGRLLARFDAVIGPCANGSVYLLGLRKCDEGLLADLPWDSPSALPALRDRLHQRGMKTKVISRSFNVSWPLNLGRLQRLLRRWPLLAPATASGLV